MKRTATVSVMFLFLGIFASASHAADMNKAQRCTSSGGVFKAGQSPECDCGRAPDKFNLLMPGPSSTLQAINRRAFYKLDMCESRVLAKTSENIRKTGATGEKTPVSPSTPFMAKMNPISSGDTPAPAGTALKTSLIITSSGKGIKTLAVTCDNNCLVNERTSIVDSKVKSGPQAIDFEVKPVGAATKGGKAVLTVSVTEVGSSASNDFRYDAEWLPKEPPAPVETPCKKSGGTDSPNSHCYCPGDELEESKTAPYVCVKKAAVAPAAVVKTKDGRDGSSRLHLRVDPFVGYAKSDDFKTAIFGLALGVSFDFLTNLSGYVEGGMQFPGATRTDSANRPVLLSDGSKDQRSNSLMVEAGVEFQAAEYVLLSGGVLFQALGVTAGQTNPVHSTLSTKFGVKVVAVQMPAFRLAIGPSVLMGVESRGNTPANFWFGGLFNVTAEFWNIIPWSK